MQQKQENVCQIGLLQNNTLACVSKGLLFKHMMKMCVSVHLSCQSSLCNFNTKCFVECCFNTAIRGH